MKWFVIAAALLVAVFIVTIRALPPARQMLPAAPADGTIAGILHVHTVRSDGRGTPEDVASAVAKAGLKFVVFTDHGDATRPPDPPTYRAGVLCLDGVEISTTGGHYVAVGLGAAPYPLGGEPRDVVEDVRRLGGFGVVAHPDSPKAALQWRDWTAPFDAIETLNPDTSWRRQLAAPAWRPRLRLAQALLTYPIRSSETIASLLEPSTVIDRWASLVAERRVVTLAGADAHAKLAFRDADPGDNRLSLPFPGYEATLATLSVHARLAKPLSGDAAADAEALVQAFRSGHLYSVVDAVATPPSFDVVATSPRGSAREGDELSGAGPVTFHVRTNAPPSFTLNLWNGAARVASRHAQSALSLEIPGLPGAYWIDIHSSTPDQAWLSSNPVYIREKDTRTPAPTVRSRATQTDMLFNGESVSGWRIEHDDASLGAVEVAGSLKGPELRFRYALASGESAHRYVALLVDRPNGVPGEDRIGLTMRAERPMRVSIQLRAPRDGRDPGRWARSIYLDDREREQTVFLDELVPIGDTAPAAPDLPAVRSVMIVVDKMNTKPGSSGRIWVRRAVLQR